MNIIDVYSILDLEMLNMIKMIIKVIVFTDAVYGYTFFGKEDGIKSYVEKWFSKLLKVNKTVCL